MLGGPILSGADIDACVEPLTESAAGAIVAAVYGSVNNATGLGNDQAKCLSAIGKGAVKLSQTIYKGVSKCRNAILKGKVKRNPRTCAQDDPKVAAKIAKIEAKVASLIDAKCDDTDIQSLDLCNAGIGGVVDRAAAKDCIIEIVTRSHRFAGGADAARGGLVLSRRGGLSAGARLRRQRHQPDPESVPAHRRGVRRHRRCRVPRRVQPCRRRLRVHLLHGQAPALHRRRLHGRLGQRLERIVTRLGRDRRCRFRHGGIQLRLRTFDDALAAYRRGEFDGVGFCLGDGWAGIDLDHATEPDMSAEMHRSVDGHLRTLYDVNAYIEVSPSGKGFKVIGRADRMGGEVNFAALPPVKTTWHGARFFAITGQVHAAVHNVLADLTGVLDAWFPITRTSTTIAPAPTDKPDYIRDGSRGLTLFNPRSDREALMAAATATNRLRFLKLFRGDLSDYGNDHSRADQALVNILVYWSNGDLDQADRLFRVSALYRDKWEARSYRMATLKKAAELFARGLA